MAKKVKGKAKSTDPSLLRRYRSFCIGLFAAAFMLYANTLGHEYAFDDSVAITANEFTKKGAAGIPDLLTKDLFAGIYGQSLDIGGGRWRPLSLVMFALEWELMGGPSPGLSHFINIILFACSMVLMFLVLVRWSGHALFALLVTLLFLFHPVHSEVVANIKSRDEILSLFFLLAALWFLFSEGKNSMIKAAACYALALLSKESGILFLLFLPFIFILFRNSDFRQAMRRTLPFFIVGVLYLLVRSALVGTIGDKTTADIMENHLFGAGFAERTATVALIFLNYLRLFFFPHPLSSDYSYNQIPVVGWGDMGALLSLVLHLGLCYLAIHFFRKRGSLKQEHRFISFGILFYLINLGLVSNLLFNVGAPLGERFMYTASLGACMAVAAGVVLLLKFQGTEPSWTAKPALLVLTLCIPMAGKTFFRNAEWSDNVTLFRADAIHAPNSAKVHFYLGNSLYNKAIADKTAPDYKEWLNEARGPLKRAVEIHPGFHHAWNKLGMVYADLKMADSAIYALEKAIENVPKNQNLSEKEKGTVLSLDKTGVDALATLGSVYGEQKGDFARAVQYLNESLKFHPNNMSALQNLGIAYAMQGDVQNAIATFEKALLLDPNNGNTYVNLGKLYGNSGNMKKAEEYFQRARSLGVEVR